MAVTPVSSPKPVSNSPAQRTPIKQESEKEARPSSDSQTDSDSTAGAPQHIQESRQQQRQQSQPIRKPSYDVQDEVAFSSHGRQASGGSLDPKVAMQGYIIRPNGGPESRHGAEDKAVDASRYDMLSPTRARLEAFREQDRENMRSAEREASRMRSLQRAKTMHSPNRGGSDDDTNPSEKFATSSEHDGDSFDRRADHPAHVPMSQRLRVNRKPLTKIGKFFKWVHNFSMITRWILYITPPTLIILVPLLVGSLVKRINGKVLYLANIELQWWAVWWEIIWLSLWAGKLASKIIPLIVGPLFSIFTNSYIKWRDLSIALETAFTLFFWWLAIYISWLPIAEHHQNPELGGGRQEWITTLNRIILAIFIFTVLNLIEKFLIQLVAIGFHQRQYEDRIVINKFNIASLTKLYKYSREQHRLEVDTQEYDEPDSGARTPAAALGNAARVVQNTARDAIGKVTGEMVGKRMEHSTSPRQMVLALLDTTSGAQTLARRLYNSYHYGDEDEEIKQDQMRGAFDSDEEADAAFAMFDQDFNGDVTCEEMEMACVEIGKERKAITSSLKDLDHAVSKLDDICMVAIVIVVILIFVALISRSFAGVLTSAGTTILGLSWLFSQLAQEFLASVVFVFVKHPFDVGDRCDVLMNGVVTSVIVKEISLLATEFRMLDGRVVQAPNNVLNQLFILNMRRTGGVAEGVPITLRFGVSIELIDQLRARMLDFVRSEPRDYKPDILTELTDIPNLLGVKLSIIFFHKQNWQNEGLRIGRRNKFMCALMVNCQSLGLDSYIYNQPGGNGSKPMYVNYMGGFGGIGPTGSKPDPYSGGSIPGGAVPGGSVPGGAVPGGTTAGPLPEGFQHVAGVPGLPQSDSGNTELRRRVSLANIQEEAVADDYADSVVDTEDHASSFGGMQPHPAPTTTAPRPSQNATPGTRRRRGRLTSVSNHMNQVDYSLGACEFAASNANDFFEETQQRGYDSVREVAEQAEERRTEEKYNREKDKASRSRMRSNSQTSNGPPGPGRLDSVRRVNTAMSVESRRNRFRLIGRRDHNNLSNITDEEASVSNDGDGMERIASSGTVASQQPRKSASIRRHVFNKPMIQTGNLGALHSAGQPRTAPPTAAGEVLSPSAAPQSPWDARPSDASFYARDMSVIPEESSRPPSISHQRLANALGLIDPHTRSPETASGRAEGSDWHQTLPPTAVEAANPANMTVQADMPSIPDTDLGRQRTE
ncbi:hypothetical protein PYCC9005_003877 [Savitreella phatthalungensis]